MPERARLTLAGYLSYFQVADLKPEMKAAGAKPFLRKTDIGIRIFRRRHLPARYQV